MLVSVPAGYGKSTLLACWLKACDIPSAWVSLDKNDNNLHLFLAYLLDAVQTLFPAAGQNTEALLNAPNLPPLTVLAHSLINDLDQIDHSFQMIGKGQTAIQMLRRKLYNETSEGTRKIRLLASLLFIHLLSGELIKTDEAVRQTKDMATRINNAHMEVWTSYLQGIIHYQWNNLETMKKHTSSIYSKLDSHNRQQAVTKVYRLGILKQNT